MGHRCEVASPGGSCARRVERQTTRVTTGTNEGSRVVEKAAASPTAKGEALARAREASLSLRGQCAQADSGTKT